MASNFLSSASRRQFFGKLVTFSEAPPDLVPNEPPGKSLVVLTVIICARLGHLGTRSLGAPHVFTLNQVHMSSFPDASP
jgi:hypothetical protein